MKWFPERPGLATGIAIMGFGGGALFAAPLATALMSVYDPQFDPAVSGSYASGDAVAATFLTLGGIYAVMMLLGATLIRIPPGFESDETADHMPALNGALVRTKQAVRTPAFYLLWIVLFCNVTAGIGILEEASPMIQDFFRGTDGNTAITAGMAAGFVGLLSLANMGGRFGWSTLSDKIGRKWAYILYLGVGLVMYFLLATVGGVSVALFVFLGFMIITFYGGGFATIPAYLKDMFGTLEVGAIHGRLLTAWSAAGICGPLIINSVLDYSGGTPGTLTADAYKPAFLIMIGVLAIGFISNILVRAVDRKRWDEPQVARYRQRLEENPDLANAIWKGGH
jgi:MFS family permease